ncbi:MAG: ABC transporter substrate-binding protein [Sedimenticola thiotaurini]|uniref:ABC transporter substrate-binding protein n=1 Tax=Sedimenticola thiotaurini TaxID=1543721 RepID=A0A558D6M3_9GAMM|nr:MAG: ABC transporter substrate-binding protein [Sedimenticola thiotaurini]
MQRFATLLLLVSLLLTANAWSVTPTIRVGVLKFGTVNWELQIIKAYKLDQAEGFNLEIVPYAGKLATTTALHGGAVDVIVNDWVWVSRQRSEGRAYSFIPYSRMNGALMVAPNSGIKTLADLQGKTLGIAGGPIDKNWLLIRAFAQKKYNINLAKSVNPIYAAPPLLASKLENGELDAVITFWHYAAELETKGFKRLIGVTDVLTQLGMDRDVPMIGYVFSSDMADTKSLLVQAFSRASRKAKQILRTQPEAWEIVKPMMRAKSEKIYQALKVGFSQSIPSHWGVEERSQAAMLFQILADLGGKKLVGKVSVLDHGTFIADVHY